MWFQGVKCSTIVNVDELKCNYTRAFEICFFHSFILLVVQFARKNKRGVRHCRMLAVE